MSDPDKLAQLDDAAQDHLARLRARAHATLVAETCDICRRGHGQHYGDCPQRTCSHGVEGECAYCKTIQPADDGPDEDDRWTEES